MIRKFCLHLSCLLLTVILFNSCSTEKIIPVHADFDIVVIDDDYSVPVTIKIINKTIGADTYKWIFEGATEDSSTLSSPEPRQYIAAGDYNIRLTATNKDGAKDIKIINVKIDAAMKPDFDWEMVGSNTSPVKLKLKNKSLGALSYNWIFEGGSPENSAVREPEVIFNTEGEHIIKLTIFNGRETYSIQKSIIVKPAMTIDFEWQVDFIDTDYQAPVLLHLINKCTNATNYEWNVNNADPVFTNVVNPDILFNNAGTYVVKLSASNDKETKVIEKKITIYPDKNILEFNDVRLGINVAHRTIGCFFSSVLGRVIKEGEVSAFNGSLVDFVFFGLNSRFSYNLFVSPDQAQNFSFTQIPSAIRTNIINSQEVGVRLLSADEFDAITIGSDLDKIIINENTTGKEPFDNNLLPRVIVFNTSNGRKGALKIKSFTSQGNDSYITVDVKVQKSTH